jgi:hypothetical protein
MLIEAKGRVEHGEWLYWLKANFHATSRTAQKYMLLAEHWPAIAANAKSTSFLSIEDAVDQAARARYSSRHRRRKHSTAAATTAPKRQPAPKPAPVPSPVGIPDVVDDFRGEPGVDIDDDYTQLFRRAEDGDIGTEDQWNTYETWIMADWFYFVSEQRDLFPFFASFAWELSAGERTLAARAKNARQYLINEFTRLLDIFTPWDEIPDPWVRFIRVARQEVDWKQIADAWLAPFDGYKSKHFYGSSMWEEVDEDLT